MKKIVIMSDNHGDQSMIDYVKEHEQDGDYYIHCGDSEAYFNRELAMNDILTRNHCQVLISGHTHMPMFQKDGSFYYINPGSTTLPRGGSARSYAVLFIDNGKLDFRLKEIQK